MSKTSKKKAENKKVEEEIKEEEKVLQEEEKIEDTLKTVILDLEEKIKTLESEKEELKNDFLRKSADLDNYKKRLIRDKEEAVNFANKSLINDLLPTLDNLDLALKASENNNDYEGFVNGVKLVQKHLLETLEQRWGLKKMDCEGQEFDPQLHEACMMETDENVDKETVSMNLQTGYTLHEKVLRPAKVKVVKPC